MRSAFETEGDLRGVDLLAAFVSIWRAEQSGSFTAWRGGSRCGFDVLDGELVGVSTTDARFETSAILVRAGKLDAAALERLAVPEGSDRSLAALQAGIVTRREWRWGEKIRAIEVLADLLTWIDGDYTFDSGTRPEAGEFRLAIPRLILELFLRSRDRNLIDHQLGPADVPLVRDENFDAEFSTFGLTADAESVVRLIDGRASAEEIASKAPAEDFAVQKLLAALMTLGLVRPEYAPEEPARPMAAAPPPPADVETLEDAEVEVIPDEDFPEDMTRAPEPFEEERFPAPPEMPVTAAPYDRASEPVVRARDDWEMEPAPRVSDRDWSAVGSEASEEGESAGWEPQGSLGEAPEPLDRPLQHPEEIPPGGRRGGAAAVLWIVLLLAIAGGVFFYLRSRRTAAPPAAQATLAPTAEPTVVPPEPTQPAQPTARAASPAASPAAAPAIVASPILAPNPRPAATRPAPTVPPRATAPPPPPSPAAPAQAEAARAWAERARGYQRRLATEGDTRYAIQLELACEVPTLVAAWRHDRPAGSMWLLPVNHRGRDCFRVLWGRYPTIEAARAAKPRIPSFFVTPENRPAVVGVR